MNMKFVCAACSKILLGICMAYWLTAGTDLATGQEPTKILRQAIPDRLVVLTFDDGVVSHATNVAPLLKEYGFGGTFFVCEFPPDFDDKSKYMTWEQIQSLNEMGFEVANHTGKHTHVDKLSREQLVAELKYIEDKCTALKIERPTSFAYPAYLNTPLSVKTLAETGYHWARVGGAKPYNPVTDHPLLIPSYSTTGDNSKQVLDALKQARAGQIIVLTVHGVPDTAHPWVNTPLDLFKSYLDFLKENNYTVIAMRDLDQYIDHEAALSAAKL